MRVLAWAVLALVLGVLAVACLVQAFTRFGDDVPPPRSDPSFAQYEQQRYAEARQSILFGIGAAFLLLGAAACGQRAWRRRTALRQDAPHDLS